MTGYFSTPEYQLDLMLDRELDAERAHERRIEDLQGGVGDYVLMPEGDPDREEDYLQNPQPTDLLDTCEHGLYWTEGAETHAYYHLNSDLAQWELCDEDVDLVQWAKEGRPTVLPL